MTERYTAGYENNLIGWFSERSVRREGAFFLPYLAEGMKVLDIGCGPGKKRKKRGQAPISPVEKLAPAGSCRKGVPVPAFPTVFRTLRAARGLR